MMTTSKIEMFKWDWGVCIGGGYVCGRSMHRVQDLMVMTVYRVVPHLKILTFYNTDLF